MIKSMTGFGRGEVLENDRKFTVEIKSVNHRYLDLNIKMPKKFSAFEGDIRNTVKNYLERGKVDIFVTYEDMAEGDSSIKYNSAIARQYFDYLGQMAKEFGIANDVTAPMLSRYPDVLVLEEQNLDEEELWGSFEKALTTALKNIASAREKEGEALKVDLLAKLDEMSGYVDFIVERSPKIVEEYKAKLEEKVSEMLSGSGIDENRIAAEVTMFADKICVDEEMVRLRTHIDTMKKDLTKGGAVGRKLDFIAQEMNREANTTLSKTTDSEISDVGINLKTLIEKIREQIQNIE